MRPLVILGTGLAGYTLAREFRKLNSDRPMLILSQDDGRSYSKPMLSNALAKGKIPDTLAMASPETMAEQLNAEVLVTSVVSRIDAEAKTLMLNGQTLAYEDLVLAVGAEVFRPPLGGDAADSVLSVNDLGDYAVFRELLGAAPKRVLIIGGGLIGCEFANDLAAVGHSVTVVEPMGRPLATLLPERASQAIEAGLQGLGVNFLYGANVTAADHMGSALRVSLADGRHAEADIVLSAIGLRPRTGLAEMAGLKVARGICVDRHLRSSNAHIFAIGDCAEVDGKVLMYVLPLMASARALAKTLSGEDTVVSYPAMPVQIKTPICPIVVSPVAPGTEGAWAVEANGQNVKASFLSKQGQLLGFALTGSFATDMKEKMGLARALPPILA
jgi:rubredoxin-NAD+ reductase